jgi:DNA-binding response OmpR family regulator
MSVTPLPLRAPHHPRTHRRRTPPQPLIDAPELRLTFEVTLGGDTRYSDAVEVLGTLRQLTDRLGSASATSQITPSAGPVGPARAESPAGTEDDAGDDGGIRVHADSRTVVIDGRSVALTRVEFDLLHFFARNPRRVFTRGQLLQSVWGYAHAGHRTVDVHVRRLRAKLELDSLVTTVRGVGYRLGDDVDLRVVRQP